MSENATDTANAPNVPKTEAPKNEAANAKSDKAPIKLGTHVIEEGVPSFKPTPKGGARAKYKPFIDDALKLTPEMGPRFVRVPIDDGTDEKRALLAVKLAVKNAGVKDKLNIGILTNGGIGLSCKVAK